MGEKVLTIRSRALDFGPWEGKDFFSFFSEQKSRLRIYYHHFSVFTEIYSYIFWATHASVYKGFAGVFLAGGKSIEIKGVINLSL